MPQKHILLITTELRPGGAEKCLANLACGLDKSKFRCRVVSIWSKPEHRQQRLVEKLGDAGIEIDFLNCDSKLSVFSAVKKLKKIIVEHKIDLVQSFLFPGNLVAGIAVSQLAKSQQSSVRLFTGIRVADPSRFRHFVERRATKIAKKIICVSDSVKQFAEIQMRLPRAKLISIPNGIDAKPISDSVISTYKDSMRSEWSSFGIDRPFALFVGRLTEQKGLAPFLSEFAKVDDQIPPVDLVFVGDGPIRKTIEGLAAALKHRRCHFVGWQSNPQAFILAAETLFLPSLWEGMPNVLLETMASARPFVAFSVDGVSELLNGNIDEPSARNQIQCVPPGDYQQFFDNLTQVVGNKELAAQIGMANQECIAANFSLKKMIAEYEQAYLGF